MTITTATLTHFLTAAQAKADADYAHWQCKDAIKRPGARLSLETGRRYARIVSEDGASRFAFGFVDLTNGDVLKADGWKAPAKNFARGNVSDANTGTGRISWTGVS